MRGARQITWAAGPGAQAPGCVRFGICPSRTRCSLHAAPAIAAVTRAFANSILTLFALVPSSTGGACRYFLPFLRPGVQSPRLAAGDAGGCWSCLVSMIYKSQPTCVHVRVGVKKYTTKQQQRQQNVRDGTCDCVGSCCVGLDRSPGWQALAHPPQAASALEYFPAVPGAASTPHQPWPP